MDEMQVRVLERTEQPVYQRTMQVKIVYPEPELFLYV